MNAQRIPIDSFSTGTPTTEGAGPIPKRASRGGAASQDYSLAGERPVAMGGKSATGMQHQHGATLAEALYGGALGRSFQPSSWQDSQPTERPARGADFDRRPTKTPGWLDALE